MRRKESRNRRSQPRKPALETLESRKMFAAGWSLSSGALIIHADDDGSQVQVSDLAPANPNSTVILSTQSNDANWAIGLPKSSIKSIRFNGSDSDDTFVNNTGITSRIFGYGGSDELSGGTNTDRIFGMNGDDVLKGNNGRDYLYGGNGDDVAFGGSGNDYVYGQGDNDHLLGGSGDDVLSGGSGRDGLYGGWGTDTIYGGSGPDRNLRHMNDLMNYVGDFTSEDVTVNFGDADFTWKNFYGTITVFQAGEWAEEDVLQVDKALDLMASRTGNNVLLQDVDGSELNFYRHGDATSFPFGGTSYTAYNSGGDMYFSDDAFTDEDKIVRTVVHEIGHNWDSASEVEQKLPGQGDALITSGFRAESVWIKGTEIADLSPAFVKSGDGKWTHFVAAPFARAYGRTNPAEDFATAFAAYFIDLDGRPYNGAGAAAIPGKIEHIENLLDQLSNVEFDGSSDSEPGVFVGSPALNVESEPILALSQPAPVFFDSGVVTVHGTEDNDTVAVSYVDSDGGLPTNTPTDWIRIQRTNSSGTVNEYFQASKVEKLSVYLHGRDDTFINQTSIESTAYGGVGNDLLIGGSATDVFFGGTGNDRLLGRAGNDVLAGEDGDDGLWGGLGFDFLVGGRGYDRLDGGADDDSLYGGLDDDTLLGRTGDDVLDGGDGVDALDGGRGRDILIGGGGRDELNGGKGQDILIGGQLVFANNYDAIHDIRTEWTSDHSFGHRRRNVLGFAHPAFAERLNGDSFLTKETVIDDGALDEYFTQFADDDDLLLVGDFDKYLPLGSGDVAVKF